MDQIDRANKEIARVIIAALYGAMVANGRAGGTQLGGMVPEHHAIDGLKFAEAIVAQIKWEDIG